MVVEKFSADLIVVGGGFDAQCSGRGWYEEGGGVDGS